MSGLRRYRKKPVEIVAFPIRHRDDLIEAAAWVATSTGEADVARIDYAADYVTPVALFISTLEGVMRADVGDYVIRGVEGEFYPCKPSVFEATYEEIL